MVDGHWTVNPAHRNSGGSNPVYNAKIFTKNVVKIEISNFLTMFMM